MAEMDRATRVCFDCRKQRPLQRRAVQDAVGSAPADASEVACGHGRKRAERIAGEKANELRLEPDFFDVLQDAEFCEDARGIRRDLQAGADLCKRRSLLENIRTDAAFSQGQSRGQARSSGADDGGVFDRHPMSDLREFTLL